MTAVRRDNLAARIRDDRTPFAPLTGAFVRAAERRFRACGRVTVHTRAGSYGEADEKGAGS